MNWLIISNVTARERMQSTHFIYTLLSWIFIGFEWQSFEQIDEEEERENVCEWFFLVKIVPDDVRESDTNDFNETLRSSSSSSSSSSIYKTCVQSSVGLSSDDGSLLLRTLYSSAEDEVIRSKFWWLVCMISMELEKSFDGFCKERRTIGMERMMACEGEIGEWRNDRHKMRDDVSN